MIPNKKLTNYVSEIDQFLQKFDKEHPELSKAQHREKKKYKRIYALRDSAARSEAKKKKLWDGF
jgi:hypothetical protein